MRRTDRLFDLIQTLRDGRLHRAGDLAAALGVSTRTIWRDIATLQASGLPVEGERGVGYILRAPITLPPLMLSAQELDALRSGLRLVVAGDDAGLARAARDLATKLAAVTPLPAGPEPDDLFARTAAGNARAPAHLPLLRAAIKARERVTIGYIELNGAESHRDIRPLALDLKARVWTLAAWCEAQGGFRSFRLDRLMAVLPTAETFPDEPGRNLRAFRAMSGGSA